jgi:hypothetical protein
MDSRIGQRMVVTNRVRVNLESVEQKLRQWREER